MWWCFQRYTSKLITLYILNMCSLFYANYSSIKPVQKINVKRQFKTVLCQFLKTAQVFFYLFLFQSHVQGLGTNYSELSTIHSQLKQFCPTISMSYFGSSKMRISQFRIRIQERNSSSLSQIQQLLYRQSIEDPESEELQKAACWSGGKTYSVLHGQLKY